MKAETRLSKARDFIKEARALDEDRKNLGSQIKAATTKLEEGILEKTITLDEANKLQAKVNRLEVKRAAISSDIKDKRGVAEQLILGEGDFDASQRDFEDLEDEKGAEKKA